ncbi:hypothetical protein [Methanolobus sp.]|uniref:hypothetical protein n=1 Tax=Methanolobus sp. TaxID=1874737 RepID=UPI0025FDAA3E|nr:hypothetical protein [Methanolobus sp.]
MPDKNEIILTLDPELLPYIDVLRGYQSRSTYIKKVLRDHIKGSDVQFGIVDDTQEQNVFSEHDDDFCVLQ